MAKVSKKRPTKRSKAARAKAATKRATPVSLDAKIKVLKRENPFREGTAVYKRVNAVFGCGGKTVEAAVKKGARRSTVRWLRDHHQISVSAH